MKEVISRNIDLVEKVLSAYKVNKQVLEDLESLNNLNDNIETKYFHPPKNDHGWVASFRFLNPLNSKEEFIMYLDKNHIKNYRLIEEEKHICEDYSIIFDSKVRGDFCNP